MINPSLPCSSVAKPELKYVYFSFFLIISADYIQYSIISAHYPSFISSAKQAHMAIKHCTGCIIFLLFSKRLNLHISPWHWLLILYFLEHLASPTPNFYKILQSFKDLGSNKNVTDYPDPLEWINIFVLLPCGILSCVIIFQLPFWHCNSFCIHQCHLLDC